MEMNLMEVKECAQIMSGNKLFGMTKEELLPLMLLCQAEGIHPAMAVRKYHVIMGRPSMKAEAMLSEFQKAGGRVKFLERSNTACRAEFSHPQGGSLEISYTIEDAKRAGLTTKSNSLWGKYPRQMLHARCVSEGIRSVYPAIVCGMYTPEEVRDFDDTPSYQPQEPAATKVETIKPAEVKPVEVIKPVKAEEPKEEIVDAEVVEPVKAEEPKATGSEIADLIKQARKHLVDLGIKNLEDLKVFTKQVLNREETKLTSLSKDELITVIECKM